MDALHHRAGGQHVVHAPAVGGAHIHEFNETQDDAAALEMPGHGQDFMVVGSPLDHHIDLDRPQACGLRSGDAFEHIRDRKIHIVHTFEDRVIQAVQADGDTLQTRSFKGHRFARQQGAVGGERQIQRLTLRRAQGRQLGDQHFEIFAQQGLATGEPDLLHAMGDELACNAGDFFKAEQFRLRQVDIILIENLFGHAVAAAEIAAVGHADAQVVQGAPQTVLQVPRGPNPGGFGEGCRRCGQAQCALVEQRENAGRGIFGHGLIVTPVVPLTYGRLPWCGNG